jgi:nucleotide-binding universal stress UspA family protein
MLADTTAPEGDTRDHDAEGATITTQPEAAARWIVPRDPETEVVNVFSNVVVPLDGSRLAEQALPWATALATDCQAPLQLLTVVQDEESGEAEIQAGYLESLARQLNRDVGTSIRRGRPAAELVAAVREFDEPIIVMATHGYSGADPLRFGSVADRVVHAAEAPVLLVRSGMEQDHQPPIRSILVPLDGSANAEAALRYATRLAELTRARLRLARVVETRRLHSMLAGGPYMTTGTGPLADVYQAAVEQAQQGAETYLAEVAERLRASGIPIQTTLLSGTPDEEIRLAEQRYQPDLVVMATHGRGGANWLVFGSTAERVLKLGSTPVLMVRPPRQADEPPTEQPRPD